MQDIPGLSNNPHITQDHLVAVHDELFNWCLSRCNYDKAPAEDLLQEVYIEVLSGKAFFNHDSSLKTFLFSVAQNIARNHFRSMRLRLKLITEFSDSPETDNQNRNDGEPENKNNPIWQAVRSLPAKQRDMTELVFYREFTIQEASSIMGISVGSGRTHYQRAKDSLAKILGSDQQ